jgi:hypothetical protein
MTLKHVEAVYLLSTRDINHAAETILRLNNSESEKRSCTSLLHDRRCFTIESIAWLGSRQLLRRTLRPQQRGRDLHTKDQATEHEASKQFGYDADIL